MCIYKNVARSWGSEIDGSGSSIVLEQIQKQKTIIIMS